ncbi:hypothetical protein EC988_007972 [Linderina pennispora]|nr:hypothetical protein EC988_007972 [Linderina pennispora]
MFTQSSYMDGGYSQFATQPYDLSSQPDTVVLGQNGSEESKPADDPKNTFNPKLHASIMFSQSDRVQLGSDEQGTGANAPKDTRQTLASSQFNTAYMGNSSQASQAYLTQDPSFGSSQFTQEFMGSQNFTQY